MPALAVGLAIVAVVGVALVVRHVAGPSHRGASASSTAAHGTPSVTTPVPVVTPVVAGPARRFGESVGADTGALAVVAATAWLPTAVLVETWTRRGTTQFGRAAPLLPPGFHRGYDPSAASLSDGSIVVSAGVDLNLRPLCLDGGSVAIQRVTTQGASAPVLVDDERGSQSFDDRPTVAAGSGSEVWVGWSQGTRLASCDLIGRDDQVHIALSTDGGRTFGAGLTIPAAGANFGVQIAPTGPGAADIAWTQTLPTGTARILLAHVDGGRVVGAPSLVGAGTLVPARLPGASFPSFTIPALTLVEGQPMLAWASWVGGRAVLRIAVPAASGGRWVVRTVLPAPGTDDLLPALGSPSGSSAVLLYAVHRRSDDAVSYLLRGLTRAGDGRIDLGPARSVLAGAAGPGFNELGESLQISAAAGRSTTALVAGGANAARIWTANWSP